MLVHVRIGWPTALKPFVYPVAGAPAPRTAVLTPWFRQPSLKDGRIRIFAGGWCEQAAHFAPFSLAATFQQLRRLERVPIPSLSHALIVLHPENEPRLVERERDWLWHVFGLPVFEQVIGARGQLLATECEAHQGLHVETVGRDLALANLERDPTPCPCGRTTPRTATSSRKPAPKIARAGG